MHKLDIFQTKRCSKIAYIRYKVGDDFHKTVKEVCRKLGIKESELSRIALVEYLRKLSVLSDKLTQSEEHSKKEV